MIEPDRVKVSTPRRTTPYHNTPSQHTLPHHAHPRHTMQHSPNTMSHPLSTMAHHCAIWHIMAHHPNTIPRHGTPQHHATPCHLNLTSTLTSTRPDCNPNITLAITLT